MAHIVTSENSHGVIKRKISGANRAIPIGWRLCPEWMASTCVLRFVDLYGVTILNRLQCEAVVPELQELGRRVPDDLTSDVDDLINAAEECARHPHTFVRFRGD